VSDRRDPRVPIDAVARVRSGSLEIKCRVVDLSVRGMALETCPHDSLGRFVRVTAEVADGSLRLDMDAIVVNSKTVDGEKRWGVEFHDPMQHQVSRIADYVRDRLAAESPEKASEETLAPGEPDPSAKPGQAPATDPEVQRLFEKALNSLR